MLLAVVVSLVAACSGCGRKVQPPPFYLGQLVENAGSPTGRSLQAMRGVDLAIRDANIESRLVVKHRPVVLLPEVKGQPRAVAVRLLAVNHVAALVAGDDPGLADLLGPIAQSYATPVFVTGGHRPRLSGDYVFPVGMSPTAEGHALALFAAQELKRRNCCAFLDRRDRSSAVADAFTKQFREQPALGSVQVFPSMLDGEQDVIDEALQTKPDVVLVVGAASNLAALWKSQLDVSVPVLWAGEGGEEAAAPAGRLLFQAVPFVVDAETKAARDFVAKYRERHGELPDVDAALAYDCAEVAFAAMRKVESFGGPTVREALVKHVWETLTGPLTWDAKQPLSRRIYVVQRGVEGTQTKASYAPEVK
jgi:ABC-type branched-subunit amino acid transport system substrate-binding protein